MAWYGGDRSIVYAGLSAAVLWFGSGALFSALSFSSVLPHQFVAHIVPATFAANAWQWPPKWAALAICASALVVFFAFLWCARVSFDDAQTSRTRFFLLWFAAIVSGFIATVPWVLTQTLGGFPFTRLAAVLEPMSDSLLRSGYWGIVWGWLPALIAVTAYRAQLSRDSQTPPRPERSVAHAQGARVSLRLLSVALVLALLASAAVYFFGHRAARLHDAGLAAIAEGRTLGAAPDPASSVMPPLSVDPRAPRAEASWCTPEQAMLLLGGADAATGHRVQTIRVMNFSETSCVLDGYPDLAFADAEGSEIAVTVEQGSSFLASDAGAQPITLEPGGYAVSRIGWNAMATEGELATYKLYAAMYPGLERGSWPVQLDIVSGGEVEVTAWELSDAGVSTD